MKQLLIALLSVAAISSFAASFVRVDIDCLPTKTKLAFENAGTLKMQKISWGKEEAREFRFTSADWKPIGDQWKEYTVAFKAENSGTAFVTLAGQWAKSVDKMGWVSVTNLKLNGELLPNGDLKKSGKDKSGRAIASGFTCSGKSQYSAEGGPDGMGMETINHNNRLGIKIQVEAGKSYTLSFVAKAAEDPNK